MGYCYYEHPIHVIWTLTGGWCMVYWLQPTSIHYQLRKLNRSS